MGKGVNRGGDGDPPMFLHRGIVARMGGGVKSRPSPTWKKRVRQKIEKKPLPAKGPYLITYRISY